MPESHINVSVSGIVVPVGNTITNHEALKVWLKDGVIRRILCVVLVDVVS